MRSAKNAQKATFEKNNYVLYWVILGRLSRISAKKINQNLMKDSIL